MMYTMLALIFLGAVLTVLTKKTLSYMDRIERAIRGEET